MFFPHQQYNEVKTEKLQAICEKVKYPLATIPKGNFFAIVANFNGIL
jgi:hypothetical protein